MMRSLLDSVNEQILSAVKRRGPDIVAPDRLPRLVAVSKLKPNSCIIEAYESGQRHFGENYIQELESKSTDVEIVSKCPDIRWHFIGHLQTNKVPKLLKIRNLLMVETVDSTKLADLINKAIERHKQAAFGSGEQLYFGEKLKVLIQVNTSGEDQKNGIQPNEVHQLARYIVEHCQWLQLAGLMTIGRLNGWNEPGPNRDFITLYQVRNALSKHLSIGPNDLELSMGMSSDFGHAIELGSTNVRVGSLIFGERPSKQT